MAINSYKLGRDLRHLRIEADMTLEQVENITGIPKSSISYIELGKGNVDVLDKFLSLARLYGKTLDELLAGEKSNADEGLLHICSLIKPGQIEQAKKVLETFITRG